MLLFVFYRRGAVVFISTRFARVELVLVLVSLLFLSCSSPALAASKSQVRTQAIDEQVNLTVTSSCGAAQVRIKKNSVLTTPFTITLPRGKTIQLKVLDKSLAHCGGLSVVSGFNRLIVDQIAADVGQRAIALTVEYDTAVLVQYGASTVEPATLSLSSTCLRGANILVAETGIGGQSGTLRTHFDAHFPAGQPLRLEAPSLLAACSDTGNVLTFVNWSAAGKAYPQGQTAIDLTPTSFTSAYAHYTGVLPTLRVESYELLHNGVIVDYVRVGENFGEFTFLLTGEAFPPEITVFANGCQTDILNRPSAAEIEIRLPSKVAEAPGFSLVRVVAADSRFSNAVPIEIRRH